MDVSERAREESRSDAELHERIEYVARIARNSTRNVYQRAKLVVQNDGNGYYWVARSPRGRVVMKGGIVNHGRSGKADWSIHT